MTPETKAKIKKHSGRLGLIGIGLIGALAVIVVYSHLAAEKNMRGMLTKASEMIQSYQQEQPQRAQMIGKDGMPLYGPDCVSRFMVSQPPPVLGLTTLAQFDFDDRKSPDDGKARIKKTSLSAGMRGWVPGAKEYPITNDANQWMVRVTTPDGQDWRPTGWTKGAP